MIPTDAIISRRIGVISALEHHARKWVPVHPLCTRLGINRRMAFAFGPVRLSAALAFPWRDSLEN